VVSASDDGRTRVGLISDTHGTLDERVADAFRGVAAIIHAGDACSADVLYELEAIAPVTVCRGNCDHATEGGWNLPPIAATTVAGVRILTIHDFLDLGEVPDRVDVVVCGHTHRLRHEWHGRTLVVNPGSASEGRGTSGRSVAILEIAQNGEVTFAPIELP